MGVTLRLAARHDRSDPAALLDAAAAWLEARDHDPAPKLERSEAPPLLVAELHPAAEPIEIAATAERFEVRAKTNTAGPGYHRFCCGLLEGLAEGLGLDGWDEVEDETGWYAARDDAELEAVFLDWLGGALAQVREMAADGMRGFSLSLPAGHVFEHDGLLATPLGPRDRAWLDAALEDPRAGIDAFAFWGDPGTAEHLRGLALTRMWTDVRWRAPLDDDERALLDEVATWVERAHGLDPSLALPWPEQSELLTLLGEESLRATRAHVKAESAGRRPSIGYRRRNVRVTLSGGWHMTVPGELAERWDERGTWVAWDERRSVWFTSLTVHDDAGHPSPSTEATLSSLPPLEGDEVFELERGPLRGLASFEREERDGELFHRLAAHAAEDHHAAIGTIVYVDESDRDWALSTWGSLTR